MESTESNESPNPAEPRGILLLEDAQYYLHESGKWARFLGIMGFIGAGFLVLGGIFFGTLMSVISRYRPTPYTGALGGIMGFVYIGLAALVFFTSLKLYQFGDGIKQGIELKNTQQVSIALGKLKSFFKIKGIIVISCLILYALIIIAGIIGVSIISHR